jgi:DNA replication and repair protein RecF
MYVESVEIRNFRNLRQLEICFNKRYNYFYGKNAQGKTNIIEAVSYLLSTKSHRETAVANLIHYDDTASVVMGQVIRKGVRDSVSFTLGEDKKVFYLNRQKVLPSVLVERFGVVFFDPEDLRLIKDGPDKRRRYIDQLISNIHPPYRKAYRQYHHLLKQRNALLKDPSVKEYGELFYIFDKQLAGLTKYIIQKRLRYLKEIQTVAQKIHEGITDEKERIGLKYQTNIIDEYEKIKDIEKIYLTLLKQNFVYDKERRTSLLGPHTDDILIEVNEKSARRFASQGQQKTVSISLKLSEVELYRIQKNVQPIVFLDDVMSELDEKRRRRLLSLLKEGQVFITATDKIDQSDIDKDEIALFEVIDGSVVQMDI